VTPVQGAGLCGIGAFLVVAVIGMSMNGTEGATPVRWFKVSLAAAVGVFLMMLAIFYAPEVAHAGPTR
jgi:hypothetical protein